MPPFAENLGCYTSSLLIKQVQQTYSVKSLVQSSLFPKDKFPEEKLPTQKVLYIFLRLLIHIARITSKEVSDQFSHPSAPCGCFPTPSHKTEHVFLCQFNSKKMISCSYFELFSVTSEVIVASHSMMSYFFHL